MKRLAFMRRPPIIEPLQPDDAEILQDVYAKSFSHSWDATAFRNFLADAQTIGFGAKLKGKNRALSGFILARVIGHEAEVLTFAVAPKARRRGLGRALLEHLLRYLYQERVETLFLEADEHNHAALTLYRSLSFREIGRRKSYYQTAPLKTKTRPAGQITAAPRSDAILLEYQFRKIARESQNTDF